LNQVTPDSLDRWRSLWPLHHQPHQKGNVGASSGESQGVLPVLLFNVQTESKPGCGPKVDQTRSHTLSEIAENVLISTKLNFSAPTTLIIHPRLARSNLLRLILCWIRVPFAALAGAL
jgi:hypothetical protein